MVDQKLLALSRFGFVIMMAKSLYSLRGQTGFNDEVWSECITLASSLLKEWLDSERIEYGDKAYSWLMEDAKTLVSEIMESR